MHFKAYFVRVFILFICFYLRALSVSHAQHNSLSEKIEKYLQGRLTNSDIPGLAIAVVHYDTVIFTKGYGFTGDRQPVTANTPFAIASLSKGFTATAVLQLVDSGLIDLDKPVGNYIPSLKINDPRTNHITTRQLLNQTSGLSDKGYPEFKFNTQPKTFSDLLTNIKSVRVVNNPGEKFHYHNPNYQLLALLVESVSGKKFPDYMQQNVFNPLGMKDTKDFSSTGLWNSTILNGHIFFFGRPIAMQEPELFIEGAGGIVSTANDMARWLAMQANGSFHDTKLISDKSLALMRTPSDAKKHYAMGWMTNGSQSVYHGGTFWTYSSEEIVFTNNGYGVVLLFNTGINPFQDYRSYLQGITDILNQKEVNSSILPYWFWPGISMLILLFFIGLSITTLFGVKQWYDSYRNRSFWKSCSLLFIRVLPIFLLFFLPQLIEILADRVLSWYRIFLMAPDVLSGTALLAFINFLIVLVRIRYVVKQPN